MKKLIGSAVLLLGLSSAVITGNGLNANKQNLDEANPYVMELSKMNESELLNLCEKLTQKKDRKDGEDLEDKILDGCDDKINKIDKQFAEELKRLINNPIE